MVGVRIMEHNKIKNYGQKYFFSVPLSMCTLSIREDRYQRLRDQAILAAERVPGISQKMGWRQVEQGFPPFFAVFDDF